MCSDVNNPGTIALRLIHIVVRFGTRPRASARNVKSNERRISQYHMTKRLRVRSVALTYSATAPDEFGYRLEDGWPDNVVRRRSRETGKTADEGRKLRHMFVCIRPA